MPGTTTRSILAACVCTTEVLGPHTLRAEIVDPRATPSTASLKPPPKGGAVWSQMAFSRVGSRGDLRECDWFGERWRVGVSGSCLKGKLVSVHQHIHIQAHAALKHLTHSYLTVDWISEIQSPSFDNYIVNHE